MVASGPVATQQILTGATPSATMSRHDSVHRESLPSIGSIMNPPLLDIKRDSDAQHPHQQTSAAPTSHLPPTTSGSYRPPFSSEALHKPPSNYPSPADSRRPSDERPGPFSRPSGQTLPPVRDLIIDEKNVPPQEHPPLFRTSAAPPEPSSYATDSRYGSDVRGPPPQPFGGPHLPTSHYTSQPFSSTPQRPTALPAPSLTRDAAPPAPVLHVNTKVETNPQAFTSPSFATSSGYGQTPAPAHYPPGYSQPPPQPYSATLAPTTTSQFPPSTYIRSPPFSAPAQFSSSYDDGVMTARVEERIAMGRPAGSGMGESVKRRLDEFGVEHGIIEIQNLSRDILQFTQHYAEGKNVHPTSYQSAPVDGSLPSIHEINHMLEKSRDIQESFTRMRDYVLQENNARRETAHDPRFSSYGAQPALPGNAGYPADAKDSNFGPEPKKRRGRAAAAGRCHSCNRSETPEWRRGPDGARTLCNACGLHYAKLTRKMGATNAKAAVTNSSLRTQSMAPSSPT